MKRTAKSLVDEAMVQVTTYTPEQARALHGHPGVQFVDVRDIRELEREGVIPGAIHAPRGMLEFWVDPESPYHRDVFAQDKEYVLFCALGWRSALATKTLMDMGLERVAHIEGGFEGWKQAGGPVEAKPRAKPKDA
ncbi:MAG TPA: rhodanese-like domain-containing protein [Burkholderiaceae bacterium]|nr:rhodanese-like domain-containing protein [Burkholderiaceae bacterium]